MKSTRVYHLTRVLVRARKNIYGGRAGWALGFEAPKPLGLSFPPVYQPELVEIFYWYENVRKRHESVGSDSFVMSFFNSSAPPVVVYRSFLSPKDASDSLADKPAHEDMSWSVSIEDFLPWPSSAEEKATACSQVSSVMPPRVTIYLTTAPSPPMATAWLLSGWMPGAAWTRTFLWIGDRFLLLVHRACLWLHTTHQLGAVIRRLMNA